MVDMKPCIEVDWSCMGPDFPGDGQDAQYTPERVAQAELFAQTAIRVLTAGQVGACPVTVRPCVASCIPTTVFMPGPPWMTPYVADGKWYNSCGCRPAGCSCTHLTKITLPGPVGAILEVRVNGDVVDSADYFVTRSNELVYVDGPEWPKCQDMTAPDTAEGTMSVTYQRGAVLDSQGQYVAGLLAKEYLDACTSGECALPASVTTIIRQGVTMEFTQEVFPGNRTGITAVDLWVAAWNPYGVKAPARVYSVDDEPPFAATWRA